MSDFLEKYRIDYHTSKNDPKYCIEYLKKINPKLDENNYLTYAFLSTNPNITEEQREEFKKKMAFLYFEEEERLPDIASLTQ